MREASFSAKLPTSMTEFDSSMDSLSLNLSHCRVLEVSYHFEFDRLQTISDYGLRPIWTLVFTDYASRQISTIITRSTWGGAMALCRTIFFLDWNRASRILSLYVEFDRIFVQGAQLYLNAATFCRHQQCHVEIICYGLIDDPFGLHFERHVPVLVGGYVRDVNWPQLEAPFKVELLVVISTVFWLLWATRCRAKRVWPIVIKYKECVGKYDEKDE